MTTIDRSQLVIRETAPRMTPPPVGRQFREALAQSGRAILQGAVSATSYLPGGQMLAAAVRGAVVPMLDPLMQAHSAPGGAETPSALPPGGAVSDSAIGTSPGSAGLGALGGLGGSDPSLTPTPGTAGTGTSSSSVNGDDMLARGQEMSMQMLRLQEAVGEEDRRFSALSNVLKARHDMAKTAIGNIR